MSAETYVGDVRTDSADTRLATGTTAAWTAAAAAAVAAAVHLGVAPEHLRDSVLHGGFFVLLALGQAGLAWGLLHAPTVRLAHLGLVGTVGVVLLYVASRTIGLPAFAGSASGHAGHGSAALVHQPIPGTIGPGMPVMPGLEGRVGVEAVGALDLLALGAELALVVALLAVLPARQRAVATNLVLGVGVSLWAAALLLRA
ncbi:hypothetical protein [Pedococcus soli]